ncbi:MAG: AhpC/TSA family protein [Bacteroidetes bacterium]|nr:AhpC/TSA family protein [Bacteroidota bacterium]MBS1756751.1 AhpC/TSA family protein [Bacteroidota bacterium]
MKLFFIAAVLFAGTATAQSTDSSFTVKGHFTSLKKGKLYLTVFGENGPKVDSSNIINGKFSFKGFASIPKTAYLSTINLDGQRTENYLSFYLEPAKILLSGTGDSLPLVKVSGSKLNEDDARLKKQLKSVEIWDESFGKAYEVALKDKNKAAMDSLDGVETKITETRRKIVGEFVKQNPSSLRGAMAILQNFGYYAEASDVEPLYLSLNDKVKNSKQGKDIKKMLEAYKKVAVGQIIPDITQYDTTGKAISLSSLRGKYVMVDFWASWCGPCRRENPNIVNAYSQYHDKGFEIFGVSYDNEKGKEKWKKAIINDKLTWYQVSDLKGWGNQTSDEFYIKAIPSNMLIDKDGKIIAKNLFGKKLTDKLAELM